jgi:hypothetical protein
VRAIEVLQDYIGAKFRAIMSVEIGGGNGLQPLLPAALMDLPVVDADAMGRAFPEAQMTSFAIADLPMFPLSLVDIRDNEVIVARAASWKWMERISRKVCTEVDSLRARFSRSAELDPETRATCAAALARLRAVWRQTPELFGADAMRALKEISRTLRAAEPAQLALAAAGAPLPTGRPSLSSDSPPRSRTFPPEAARQAPEKSSVRRRWCSRLSLSRRPDGAAGWASGWSG